ncbi:hypothetical protein POTOM_050953 [Populus tomentosa]|uniref:BHLH domain-containing protein n=1 Tax=Populus tomentosa TaxID=118781 RepID=A0A8X7Y564_POPTO|nr:hypothetical protein POTOM_050953 [Populus tomentosa]
MFPFQQSGDEFWSQISSNPYQEDIDQDQHLILGQDSLHGISNLTYSSVEEFPQAHTVLATSNADDDSGNIRCDEKKVARKEIERQRRQQMSTLHASLRNLLPLDSIKGKLSISDHMSVAVKYIKHLKSNIQDLSVKRDKLKNLSSSSTFEQGTEISDHNLLDSVTVRHYLDGLEIVLTRGPGEEGILLSRVLEAVLEEGFDVVGCTSTHKGQRHYTTIQCQASNLNCIDADRMKRKLIDVISLSRNE